MCVTCIKAYTRICFSDKFGVLWSWTIYSCGDFEKRLLNRICCEWFLTQIYNEGSAQIPSYLKITIEITTKYTRSYDRKCTYSNQLISCHN